MMIRRDAVAIEAKRPVPPREHVVSVQNNQNRNNWSMAACRCGWKWHGTGRQAANEATAAHLIFHHSYGAYLCGSSGCQTDRVIKRLRSERGLEPVYRVPWRSDPMVRLGECAVPRVPEITE